MKTTVEKTGNRNVHLVTRDGLEEECGQMVSAVPEPCFTGRSGWDDAAGNNSSDNEESEVINSMFTRPKVTGCGK